MDTTCNGFETVNLLKFESVQLKSPTITRVTFYEGRPPLQHIKGKLAEIFNNNPWLQGRLTSRNGKLVLRYPKTSRGLDPFLRVVSMPALSFDMGFSDLAKALRDLVIKRGSLCVNKEEDLFRVIVAGISEDKFALIVSMSHVIADGHTFYEVYKMLSTRETARSLIVDRVYSSRDDIDAVIRGGEDSLSWLSSPGFVVNVAGTLLRRRSGTLNLFTVDQSKIDERKKEYETKHKPKFISSTDIITAEFFSRTACDLVFMTVNFRDRIPSVTRNHAGNYQNLIAYQREDFAKPELIRSSIADYRRAISGKLPGFFRSTRVKLGAITNLATVYKDVQLPDCQLLSHRPVVDTAAFFPFEHTVIMFKSRENQLSLITCCKETSVLSKVEILGDRIV
jgi:hypothetical protein